MNVNVNSYFIIKPSQKSHAIELSELTKLF